MKKILWVTLYILKLFQAKCMDYILDREADIKSRPSLAHYFDNVKLANISKPEYDQDWPNFSEYKCFCGVSAFVYV